METREHLKFRGLAANVLAAHGASWLWLAIAFVVLKAFALARIYAPPNLSVIVSWLCGKAETLAAMQSNPWLYVLASVVVAPFAEEALFRFLPLEMARRFGPRVVVATQVAICMVLFGWLHGSSLHIFLQGVLGLILSVLYLSNIRHRSVLAGYLSCVAAHSLYNFSVLLFT